MLATHYSSQSTVLKIRMSNSRFSFSRSPKWISSAWGYIQLAVRLQIGPMSDVDLAVVL